MFVNALSSIRRLARELPRFLKNGKNSTITSSLSRKTFRLEYIWLGAKPPKSEWINSLNDGSILLTVPVDNQCTWADVKQDVIAQLLELEIPRDDRINAHAATNLWFDMQWKPNEQEETRATPKLGYSFDDIGGIEHHVSMWFRLYGVTIQA